ncbi:MAG: glycosyltransferase family 2 protein [bacterium]
MSYRECVSVIIVNYNVRDLLDRALRSLYETAETLLREIWVVDNASTDGSVEFLRNHWPQVHVVSNQENCGYGRANNQAIAQADAKYVLILNPDTVVQRGALQELVDFMESRPQAGVCGPKIVSPEGRFRPECRRGFPTPLAAFSRLFGLSTLLPRSRLFGKYYLTYLDPDYETQVDALSGACMMVRREVTQSVGPFDENYFLYGEDIDWCWRMKQAGWEVWYIPRASIVHVKGASMRRSSSRLDRFFFEAMRIFIRKHLRDKYPPPLLWLLDTGIRLRYSLGLLSPRFRKAGRS